MLKPSRKPAKKNAPALKGATKPGKNGAKTPAAKAAPAGATKYKAGKRVYFFGPDGTEGGAGDKILLGGKGANLADMTSIGLPVPPGFTITTETCKEYNDLGGKLPDGLMDEVGRNLKKVEKATGKKFGRHEKAPAAQRPLRRGRLDAGHDGHRAEPRPDRRGRRRDGRG